MHRLFRLFFLYVEPVSALAGAYAAAITPDAYLRMTHEASSAVAPSLAGSIVLRQLANLYAYFALVEALVLRSTSSRRVWKTLLLCLLIADVGHLRSVAPLGVEIYYRFDRWNAMAWGNVGFVYAGATMRVLFLLFG